MTCCERCDREIASEADWNHRGGCDCARCVTLCFDGDNCDPVDWRARAMKDRPIVEAARAFVVAHLTNDRIAKAEAVVALIDAFKENA